MITIQAPAKINWSLYVLDRRPDGYHNIVSLMQKIALYDNITFNHSDFLEINCNIDIPRDRNLAMRAAIALKESSGYNGGVSIVLEKNIPAGAGLGGGSSDAASTLIALNELWGIGYSYSKLMEIGQKIGSDVPFFIGSRAAIVTGRGETIKPVNLKPGLFLLLVKPEGSISTAEAYGGIAASRSSERNSNDLTNIEEKLNNIRLIIRALNSGAISDVSSLLRNDFEDIAAQLDPMTAEIKNRLLASGAKAALLSGSGSAVFGLFEKLEDAEKAADLFASHWKRVVETL